MNLPELLSLAQAHARGMWRYRWYAVASAWLVALVGWTVVYLLPNTYEAKSRVYVDTDNVLRPLLKDMAIQPDILSEVSLVTRAMLSRPNLEKVARETDLDLRAKSPQQFEVMLTALQKRIKVVGGADNVYSISYQDNSRQMAEAVVKTLLTTFVEDSLRSDKEDSSSAQRFLEEQLRDYERRLVDAEDALAKFKRENVGLMPDQRGDYYARLQAAMQERDSITRQLNLALQRRDELRRQIEGEEPVFGIMPSVPSEGSAAVNKIDQRLRELESELAELRLQYTDKHPRIQQILATMSTLDDRKSDVSTDDPGNGTGTLRNVNPLDVNPVYQNMKIQLSNADVEVVSLRGKLTQQQAEVGKLQGLVDKIPQVEAELQRLNRDYDVVKQNYERLLGRLESAKLSEKADESTDEVQFRVIDPPYSPLRPSGPKRILMIVASTIFAALFGVGLAFVMSELNPVYSDRRSLRGDTGLPVLGSVSLIQTATQRSARRRGTLALGMAAGCFLLLFIGVLAMADPGSEWLRALSARMKA